MSDFLSRKKVKLLSAVKVRDMVTWIKKDLHEFVLQTNYTVISSGSRIWLRGGPKFLLAYIADVAKRSHMSEVSTSWLGVQGLP